jgi:hypothetical protein
MHVIILSNMKNISQKEAVLANVLKSIISLLDLDPLTHKGTNHASVLEVTRNVTNLANT